ncbi:unnamed protein product [Protopolystoma xenopodis]|uniref:Uncharacterized protein n=1 Tax=Protopolystoma xenopodis TaxID=117903 RepID=A0A448WUS0_9PLAT|nr:unnamed protein product [Protopolystoma xenopodis]
MSVNSSAINRLCTGNENSDVSTSSAEDSGEEPDSEAGSQVCDADAHHSESSRPRRCHEPMDTEPHFIPPSGSDEAEDSSDPLHPFTIRLVLPARTLPPATMALLETDEEEGERAEEDNEREDNRQEEQHIFEAGFSSFGRHLDSTCSTSPFASRGSSLSSSRSKGSPLIRISSAARSPISSSFANSESLSLSPHHSQNPSHLSRHHTANRSRMRELLLLQPFLQPFLQQVNSDRVLRGAWQVLDLRIAAFSVSIQRDSADITSATSMPNTSTTTSVSPASSSRLMDPRPAPFSASSFSSYLTRVQRRLIAMLSRQSAWTPRLQQGHAEPSTSSVITDCTNDRPLSISQSSRRRHRQCLLPITLSDEDDDDAMTPSTLPGFTSSIERPGSITLTGDRHSEIGVEETEQPPNVQSMEEID